MTICDRCGANANHRVFVCDRVGAKDLCGKCYKELDKINEEENILIYKWFVKKRKEK